MESTKILMTTDTTRDIWSYSLELARGLSTWNCEIALAVLGEPPSPTQFLEVERIQNVSIYHHKGRLEWMDEPWRDIAATSVWLMDLALELCPDVIHLNHYAFGDLPWSKPVVVVGHSCAHERWETLNGPDGLHFLDTYRAWIRAGLQAADIVIAPTWSMLCTLQRYYGPLHANRVINHGVRAPEPMPKRKAEWIYAAGDSRAKGRSLSILENIGAELPWPIFAREKSLYQVGAGSALRTYEGFERNPPRQTTLDAQSCLLQSSIFVLPAICEPCGLLPITAAQAGCVLVLSDIPGMREMWGKDAFYIRPDDAETLMETLEYLISNPVLRAIHANSARRHAHRFSADRMAVAYWRIYRTLMLRSSTRVSMRLRLT